MAIRFKKILALWFIVQIVLPFTAPLQTCDLGDLFGTHQTTPVSSESSTTPANATTSEANAYVSPLEASTLRVSSDLAVNDRIAMGGLFAATHGLSPAPPVQQTILRL